VIALGAHPARSADCRNNRAPCRSKPIALDAAALDAYSTGKDNNMEKMLHQLETFTARGSDGKSYVIRGYEHLARLEAIPDAHGQWEPTGVAEYKLADGRPVRIDKDGRMTIAGTDVSLQRESDAPGGPAR
jgi:hypothetical protein